MSSALKALKWSTSLVGLAAFGAYCHDSRASIYPLLVMPALHLLDPEESHNLSIKLLKFGISPVDTQKDDERLRTSFKGLSISNPIGVAAGYDKNGEAIDGLLDLGFGIVEIGSVTPKPQPGNPLPRFFRLPKDNAVINRYGFNSEGHQAVFERMMERISNWMFANVVQKETRFSLRQDRLLGVNLGILELIQAKTRHLLRTHIKIILMVSRLWAS